MRPLLIALLFLSTAFHATAATTSTAKATTTATTAAANLKLYIFDCGSITFDNLSPLSGLKNNQTDVREFFVPCYLIEHSKGRMIWDGGLPLNLAGKPKYEMRPGFYLEYKRSLIDQLAEMGIQPDDIPQVSYSHFHTDHAGAANAFKNATILIQQTEYDAAYLHPETNHGYDPSLYDETHSSPKIMLNGDHDVFGDGSVRIIYTPGHTAGHSALLLDLKNTGKIILSGDLYHFRKHRELRITSPANTSAKQTLRSYDKVEQLLKSEGATLWIEHDKVLADTLKKAPEYHD